jgi:hypothetical protein
VIVTAAELQSMVDAMSSPVQVFGRRDDDRLCTLKRPAFEKRQGRKSRSVVRGGSTGSMVI